MSSKSQVPPQPVTFVAPFDDDDADLIIRSSDGAHFAVFKLILRKASPIFADMFTLPHTGPGGSPPVVDLTEDRDTIRALLQLCYPAKVPEIDTLETLSGLMAICDKYNMDGPKDVLEKCYSRHLLTKNPLLVYAIASHARSKTMMTDAARQCLHRSAAYMINTDLSTVPPISAASYQQVLKYHLACRTAASCAVDKYIYKYKDVNWCRWLDDTPELHCWFRCQSCGKSNHITSVTTEDDVHKCRGTLWWVDMVSSIARSLADTPKNAAFDPAKEALQAIPKFHPKCTVCKDDSWRDLKRFLPQLQERVEEVISEVPFEPVF